MKRLVSNDYFRTHGNKNYLETSTKRTEITDAVLRLKTSHCIQYHTTSWTWISRVQSHRVLTIIITQNYSSKQLLLKINVLDLVDCNNVEFIYRLQIIFNRRLMDLHTYVSIYV